MSQRAARSTLGALGEDRVVQLLTERLGVGRKVVSGPGDDCAVVRTAKRGSYQLLKTDCIVEDVHFVRTHAPESLGWKALCRNLSDIAAMGGTPDCALVTVAAPESLEFAVLSGIYSGLQKAAKRFGVTIVGGETSRSPGGLFISVALTGVVDASKLVLRSGGRPGDALFVTGRLGGSMRGKHLRFVPRLVEAAWLVSHFKPRAMMDLSDGLGADLPRLARASGCGFRLDREAVPRTAGCTVEEAIGDGEDYELLFALAPRRAVPLASEWCRAFPALPLTQIGELTGRVAGETDLPKGFEHFRESRAAQKAAA